MIYIYIYIYVNCVFFVSDNASRLVSYDFRCALDWLINVFINTTKEIFKVFLITTETKALISIINIGHVLGRVYKK